MCRFSGPPGYVRTKPVERPKPGPLTGVIDAILAADRSAPAKQRHTAKRIWQRLRDEHGFGGRSEEHTSELQSRQYLVCRLLLEKKKHCNHHHKHLYSMHYHTKYAEYR